MKNKDLHNEREVLKQVARGNEQAFSLIVRKYSQIIYPYLLHWLKSPLHAEEIAQDVFVRIWKKRQMLPEINNFAGYVYVTTRNRLYSELQRQISEPVSLEVIQHDKALNTPHTDLELKELSQILDQAIQSLSPRRREVFLLSRTEQLTYEEIAERLGISRSTVREHMVEALVFLRAYLQKHGGIVFSLLFLLG